MSGTTSGQIASEMRIDCEMQKAGFSEMLFYGSQDTGKMQIVSGLWIFGVRDVLNLYGLDTIVHRITTLPRK